MAACLGRDRASEDNFANPGERARVLRVICRTVFVTHGKPELFHWEVGFTRGGGGREGARRGRIRSRSASLKTGSPVSRGGNDPEHVGAVLLHEGGSDPATPIGEYSSSGFTVGDRGEGRRFEAT